MPYRAIAATSILIVGLTLAGATPQLAQAQVGTTGWQTFAGGDEVLALATDPNGDGRELWVGTEGGGLVVWNLSTETYAQYLYPQSPGLLSNDVRDIGFDLQGGAWLATPNGVVHVSADGNWLPFNVSDGLPSDDITAVAVDRDDTAWVGTYDGGVASFGAGDTDWTTYEMDDFISGDDETMKDGPGAIRVSDIVTDEDGNVWVAHGREDVTKPALSKYDPLEGGWFHISATTPGGGTEDGPATDQVLALDFDDDGVLWMGTWGRGVQSYDPLFDLWERYDEADGVCDNNVWSVSAGLDEVWVACANQPKPKGVSWWNGSEWSMLRVEDDDGYETGLPTDVVRAVLLLDEGEAILGTNGPDNLGHGLVPVLDGLVGDALTTAPGTPHSNDVTALIVDPETGDLWAGTRGFGLLRYDGSEWDRHTQESTSGDLAGDTITDLVIRDRELWISSTQMVYDEDGQKIDGGVSAYGLDTGTWRAPLTKEIELPDGDVSSLAVADDGLLWIAWGVATGSVGDGYDVPYGNGVAVYDTELEEFTEWFSYTGDNKGPAGNTVLDLASTTVEVWAATSYHIGDEQRKTGGGVSASDGLDWASWEGGDDGFKTYHGSGVAEDKDPYITGDVRSLGVDGGGLTWAGTYDLDGASLSAIWPYVDAVANEQEGPQWVNHVFAGEGWVKALVEDAGGNMWAATTRGHNYQEADLTTMTRADTARGGIRVQMAGTWEEVRPETSGLMSRAITSLAIDPNTGDMWVGSENGGIARFESDATPPPTITPCVDCPTATEPPPSSPTVPLVVTVAPSATTTPDPNSTAAPVVPTDPGDPGQPQPPPEVPEPATWVLLLGGLAVLAGYGWWRRRGSQASAG